jgi:restriction endonuclease Mrr
VALGSGPIAAKGWLNSLAKGRKAQEAKVRQWQQRVGVFNQAQQRYGRRFDQWCAETQEAAARNEWLSVYSRYRISELASLNGEEFEKFIQILFVRMDFRTELTPRTGDQGADLLVWRSAGRIAVQAKRQIQSVGNSAIQELLGGMLYYKCKKGIVATTSTFSKAAKRLAERDDRIVRVGWQKVG